MSARLTCAPRCFDGCAKPMSIAQGGHTQLAHGVKATSVVARELGLNFSSAVKIHWAAIIVITGWIYCLNVNSVDSPAVTWRPVEPWP